MTRTTRIALAGAAGLFGLATILSGGRALFGGASGSAFAGNAVPFVLWFNFLAGFAYVAAALAIWRDHRLALPLAISLAVATSLVFALFGMAVASGVAHETRTVAAMTLRTGFWIALAWALWRTGASAGETAS